MVPGCTLSVKIGIGIGKCDALHIGDPEHRMEYVLTGPPLHQAFYCESQVRRQAEMKPTPPRRFLPKRTCSIPQRCGMFRRSSGC